MKLFDYLGGLFNKNKQAMTQDARLPLKINFKTTVTLELNPILSAITHGAMLNIQLDSLKVMHVQAISSIVIDGMDGKKIYRFYFNRGSKEKRLFLQVLCDSDNVENIDEILLCSSLTEPPTGAEDIAFFCGDNQTGVGSPTYGFSRENLYNFLPQHEVDKRLAVQKADMVEYLRIDPEQEFMPAFTGLETVITDPYGTTGERRKIMNLMPHSRALTDSLFEEFLVSFWVTTSKDNKEIYLNKQLPLAEYIFAIKLEAANIQVI